MAILLGLDAHAGEWQKIAPGLSYQKISVKPERDPVTVHALKIDPRKIQIKPVFPPSSQNADKMRESSGALAVINANFFDTAGKTLGLVRVNGQTLHPEKKISWWSMLCISAGHTRIVHNTQYNDTACQHAIQAGPRLVVANSIPKLKTESSRKSAVGIQPNGQIVLVASEGEIPIIFLAELFAMPESKGGLGCPEALNFDGGSSTQLSVKAGALTLNVHGLVRVPVGLGLFAK